MLADKAYDADRIRASLRERGAFANIPPKANRKEAISCDYRAYKDRNRVERKFNKPKQFRRIATRYEKTATNYLAAVLLVCSRLWTRAYESAA